MNFSSSSRLQPPSSFLYLHIYNDTFTSKLQVLKTSDNTEFFKKKKKSTVIPSPAPTPSPGGRDVVCPAHCWSLIQRSEGHREGTRYASVEWMNKWPSSGNVSPFLYIRSHIYSVLLYVNGTTPYVLYTGFFSFCLRVCLRGLLTLYLDLLHALSQLTKCTIIFAHLHTDGHLGSFQFSLFPAMLLHRLWVPRCPGKTPEVDLLDGRAPPCSPIPWKPDFLFKISWTEEKFSSLGGVGSVRPWACTWQTYTHTSSYPSLLTREPTFKTWTD